MQQQGTVKTSTAAAAPGAASVAQVTAFSTTLRGKGGGNAATAAGFLGGSGVVSGSSYVGQSASGQQKEKKKDKDAEAALSNFLAEIG